MILLVRKDVHDEIMKGIVYHTRVSSKGKPYEVPYHTKDDYAEVHKLRIFEELPKSERKKVFSEIQSYQNKYYKFFKKKAEKLSIPELQKYIAKNSYKAEGQRQYRINSVLKDIGKDVKLFNLKYAKVIGRQEAEYKSIHDTLYEKVLGISDSEKDMLKNILKNNMEKWQEVLYSDEECLEILSKEYKTPIGKIHFGNNQLKKFNARDRQELVWAADKVLQDPSIIVETRESPIFFVKTFDKGENKDITIISIMVQGTNAIISTHPEKIQTILHKTKKNGILYTKDS